MQTASEEIGKNSKAILRTKPAAVTYYSYRYIKINVRFL